MRHVRIPALFVVIGIFAAACGPAVPSGALTQLGEGEGELNLIIWEGYAERGEIDENYDWVTPFEAETGCRVQATAMTDSANGVALLQSGQYDGGSFSGDATVRLMAAGDVAPVNIDLLPNYEKVFEGLKLQSHNSVNGVPYGAPHGRGPNLLMWNTEVITEEPTSWDPIWEGASDYPRQISIYDSSIFIADAALHLMVTEPDLGITNPYQLNDEQFAAAIDLLEQQRDNGAVYWALLTEQVQSFAAGDVVVGTTWPYQVSLLQGENAPVEAKVPDEGTTGWSDTWMISSEAEHPNCMYMWMNHMMSAEANAAATVWFGEAATSEEACQAAEALSPGHCENFHAADEAYWEKIWYWTTPVESCDDTDDATTCKDQDDWVEAWNTLRGA